MAKTSISRSAAERLDSKLNDIRRALETLHTIARTLQVDADDGFESAEALQDCAARLTRECVIELDNCAEMIGGVRGGRFDAEARHG